MFVKIPILYIAWVWYRHKAWPFDVSIEYIGMWDKRDAIAIASWDELSLFLEVVGGKEIGDDYLSSQGLQYNDGFISSTDEALKERFEYLNSKSDRTEGEEIECSRLREMLWLADYKYIVRINDDWSAELTENNGEPIKTEIGEKGFNDKDEAYAYADSFNKKK